MQAPLAERLRPQKFSDFIGQDHLLGENGSLKALLDQKIVPSMIFWGPPGVGKTTLAELIAGHSERKFFRLSAINSGVKDVREVIDKAQSQGLLPRAKHQSFLLTKFTASQNHSKTAY